MKQYLNKTNLVLVIIALVLSLGIIRITTSYGVDPCAQSIGCQMGDGPTGKLTTRKQGYPLIYREVAIFEPSSGTSYASVQAERQGFSKPNIFMNVVFWFALLQVFLYLYKNHAPAKSKSGKKKAK